jgi:acyl-coenzyme A synthetase/AMP-(fatty) acid ligase
MSETGVGTITPMRSVVKGSCGILIPNTQAKILDISTGENLGPGKTGEFCIKGPQVNT